MPGRAVRLSLAPRRFSVCPLALRRTRTTSQAPAATISSASAPSQAPARPVSGSGPGGSGPGGSGPGDGSGVGFGPGLRWVLVIVQVTSCRGAMSTALPATGAGSSPSAPQLHSEASPRAGASETGTAW
ncbi:hypothetical protein FE156_16140 [Streptomyces albidoflavus]|nr:hypothetical protein FE156_16140 [Streptomyces albidoflavus]